MGVELFPGNNRYTPWRNTVNDLIDFGSAALDLANVVTDIASNVTCLLQAWHLL